MLADFPQASHILLASGSCLPIRPVRALQAHLAQHPDTDFIESVTTADVGWTIGGLNEERFTLRDPAELGEEIAALAGEHERRIAVERLQHCVGGGLVRPHGLL